MTDTSDRFIHQKAVQHIAGGVSSMTLWRWRRRGLIPAPVVIAGRNYWRESEIELWIQQGPPQAGEGQAA